MEKLDLDFYYGKESEQFTFYRLPKALITDERFKAVSNNAKLLYGLMLDRMSLSKKRGWLDEDNKVFINACIYVQVLVCQLVSVELRPESKKKI